VCTVALQAQNANDARILEYTGLRHACDGSVTPVLKIQNVGTNTMLTCVVETWKNGLMANSFNWILSVSATPNAVRQPALPLVDDVAVDDVLEFRVISVNEQPDEGPDGNMVQVAMQGDPLLAESFVMLVEIATGSAPQGTSWTMVDALAQIVAQGGPYASPNSTEQVWVTLEPERCYELRVSDSEGDGMPGGSLRLYSNEVEVLQMDGDVLLDRFDAGVVTGTTVGSLEVASRPGVHAFPVPTRDHVQLALPNALDGLCRFDVRDATGRVVMRTSRTALSGANVELDLAGLAAGPYTIEVRDARDRYAMVHVAKE
jgi:hypothetical protein